MVRTFSINSINSIYCFFFAFTFFCAFTAWRILVYFQYEAKIILTNFWFISFTPKHLKTQNIVVISFKSKNNAWVCFSIKIKENLEEELVQWPNEIFFCISIRNKMVFSVISNFYGSKRLININSLFENRKKSKIRLHFSTFWVRHPKPP